MGSTLLSEEFCSFSAACKYHIYWHICHPKLHQVMSNFVYKKYK